MIPNIFVSSTIFDLQYLREAVRDTIIEIGHNPIMSEFGDIGYLPTVSAEEACYLSMKDCQIAIIIIGKRYGWITDNGLGITHNEFKAARNNKIPVIFLIDRDIIAYKKVFDKQKSEGILGSFPDMDHPEKTFMLIQEFSDYNVNNGFLPYSTIQDATFNIKKQLSHIFGNLLRDRFDPLKAQVQDVLSEIKTLRHELLKDKENKEYFTYLVAIRFLIDEANKIFGDFIGAIFNPIDTGMPLILKCKTFDEFIKATSWKLMILKKSDMMFQKSEDRFKYSRAHSTRIRDFPADWVVNDNQVVSWATNDAKKTIYINELTKRYFDWKYNLLQAVISKN